MSKPRRRKQKKQVKAELKLRQFAATELSDQLAAQHSAADLPRFMVDTVAGAYAPADAELVIKGFGAAAARPVTLRANTLKATAEDIAAALDAAGIAHNPVAWYPDAFILPEAQVSDLWDLDIYRDGKIYLQSLSSMMPPLVLGAQAGEDILDMCAAPGGKTTQIAALTQGQAHLTACEMNIPRAEKLESNLHRQGAKNVPVMRIDARELDEFFRFDRILLDAPCTGTGTVISGNEKSLRGLTEQLLGVPALSAHFWTAPWAPSSRAARSSIPPVRSCRRKTRMPCRRPSTSIWTASSSPSTARRVKAKHAAPRKPVRSRTSSPTPSPRQSPRVRYRPSPTACPARSPSRPAATLRASTSL